MDRDRGRDKSAGNDGARLAGRSARTDRGLSEIRIRCATRPSRDWDSNVVEYRFTGGVTGAHPRRSSGTGSEPLKTGVAKAFGQPT